METPSPFDLNEAIRRWQQDLSASSAFCADNLEELASHLRASVQKLKASGLSEDAAFKIATQRIGERAPLEREFAKVNPSTRRSLPVVLFWTVAGMYLFQIVSSLLSGFFNLVRLRVISRFFIEGVDPGHAWDHLCWFYYLPVSVMSMAVMVIFVFGVRLASGSWSGFGAFIRSFQRPIRTALCLVVLGYVFAIAPYVLTSFLLPEEPLTIPQAVAKVGLNDTYGLFTLGYFRQTIAVPIAGYTAGQGAINVALVLSMVLLARQGLHKILPQDNTLHKRATKFF